MQKFEYRFPRFAADFAIDLIVDEAAYPGRCVDISEEGMRAEFDNSPPAESLGLLTLHCGSQSMQFDVRVAYAGDRHAGLVFLFGSALERSRLQGFVAQFSAAGHPSAADL